MGLRRTVGGLIVLVALMGQTAAAAPHAPLVYSVSWGSMEEQHFPHPALCVGDASLDRQRAAAPGFHLDPDGCAAAEAVLAYADRDASGTWSVADDLYLQPGPATKVEAGHVRIGEDAPSTVKAADPDAGRTTRPIQVLQWDLEDRDGSKRWSLGDVAYLDADANGHLSPGDLAVESDMRRVALGTPGMAYPLLAAPGGLCYIDDDGSGAWSGEEPVYLVLGRACDYVAAGDLRIVTTRGQAAGTRVAEAHLDYRNPLTAFTAPQGLLGIDTESGAAAFDLDGSGTLTQQDVLAAALERATGAAGSELRVHGTWAYLDLDRSGTPTAVDVYFADQDSSGSISISDVRFGPFIGHAFGSIVADGDADAVGALPPKVSGTANDETDPAGQKETERSPFPTIPTTLGFLAGLFAVLRRRRRLQ